MHAYKINEIDFVNLAPKTEKIKKINSIFYGKTRQNYQNYT